MKKINNTLTVAAFIAMIASSVSFNSYAHKGGDEMPQEHQGSHHKPFSVGAKLKQLNRLVDLSDEQKQQIKAIFIQSKAEMKTHQASKKDFKEQLSSLMAAAVFDEQAFLNLHHQYHEQFTAGALTRAKTRHKVLQVLTAEQREIVQKMKHRAKKLTH
ncbi:Spy/CpxP family protein refolding chaperone [Thalassotalea sp. G2M2-11]|uniref:Spy/CpxP family protein refolding chaperone n=1 Tax=Thalassotalea sp. G2M2-11 TaxID=2787627 RepID=UPI0019D2F07D|nr:Spy/CpxP family protein refolding chaperone [Thalassotalea sp. G2M2-11]